MHTELLIFRKLNFIFIKYIVFQKDVSLIVKFSKDIKYKK